MVLLGPALIAAAVLVVSGLAKLFRPATAVGAFEALDLPGGTPVVRALGIVEVTLALVVVGVGGPAYYVLGAWYLALAIVAVLLVRAGSASCGCFGAASSPPSGPHVVANLVAAAISFAAAAAGVGALAAELSDLGTGAAALLLVWAAIGTGVAVAIYSVLPVVLAGASPDRRAVPTFGAVRR